MSPGNYLEAHTMAELAPPFDPNGVPRQTGLGVETCYC